jgi:2-polyprenyl-3-methyl-5-hydroxy-6-metoxy-1,4-benzoquinol methylase
MPEPTRPASRQEILRLLEEERQLIIRRYVEYEKPAESVGPSHGVRWYLDISKQWGVHVLRELSGLTPGRLLDVGAYYGLISGVAHRLGWAVAAVDNIPLPAYSSLRIPERGVESAECNACTDPLPFPERSFDVVLLTEVLEHLTYSPLPLFREVHRVLRPGGLLFITTPNPAGLGKLIRLVLGQNPIEPHVDLMLTEGQTYTHRGLTFFSNRRESKLWTAREIGLAVGRCGLRMVGSYHYGSTVQLELMSARQRLTAAALSVLFPLVNRLPIAGGSTFVKVVRPADPAVTPTPAF